MKALVLTAFGGPENFELRDVEAPELKPGHVLVRIVAASINMIDTKIREGLPIGPELPAILGCDMAGIIEGVGDGVSGFRIGDAVFGCVGGVRGSGGTMAEYILADARLLAHKPKRLSFREAAALPLVGITASEALIRSDVGKGQMVLVHGGVGGVGHVALRLARVRGARVATTVMGEAAQQLATSLGAHETIDFMKETVEAYVARLTADAGFDVIVDTVGGQNLAKSFRAAANNGQIVTTNARVTEDLSPLHAKALSFHVVFMLLPLLTGKGRETHGLIMEDLSRLADADKLRPLLDPTVFDLEHAADGHRHLQSGKAVGKVVIDVTTESRP
jgi:NADPH:quinone reductase